MIQTNVAYLPGCTCFACTADRAAARRRLDGEIWTAFRSDANRERQRMAAHRPKTAQSLSHAAQDYGLVPHRESDGCGGCRRRSDRLRTAASVIATARVLGS